MDMNDEIFKAVDKFLQERYEKGKSDVVCPICKTPLRFEGNDLAYAVLCQTPNCLNVGFRGI